MTILASALCHVTLPQDDKRSAHQVIVTNRHNPSSVLPSKSVLGQVGYLARSIGARALVNEVYLDAVYQVCAARFAIGRAVW